MAELVDALVSGASVERRAGSSPVLGTTCSIKEQVILEISQQISSWRDAQVVKLVYTLL